MHSLAEWLTASRARAFIGSGLLAFLALLVPFCTWLPGAFVVLLALRHGKPLSDWVGALVAGGVVVWGVVQAGAGPLPALLVSLALVLPPLLIGRLLQRGGSLNLGFQLATLAALALLVVVYAVLADPPGIWRPMLEKLAAELDRVGVVMQNVGSGRRPQDSDLIQASAARMWGVVAWVILLNTMVAVFVGTAVSGVLERVARLGPAFRELKAGRTLAIAAIVVTLAATAFHWSLAADAAFVFLGAFVLQGLSVLHAARSALGISVFWLVATYLMLFWPFWPYTTVFVQGGLAIFGFMDNWVPLRERFRARPGSGPSGGA